eukprot:gene32215-16773_t
MGVSTRAGAAHTSGGSRLLRANIGAPAVSRSFHRKRAVITAAASVTPRVEKVWEKIDALNAADPNKVKVGSEEMPYELAFSKWMSEWMMKLSFTASEEVLIGKTGYFRWREEIEKYVATTLSTMMEEEGFDEASTTKVQAMIQKESQDDEVKLVDEALCAVFLQHQLTEARQKESDEALVDALRRTFSKMSSTSRAVTLELANTLSAEEQRETIRDWSQGLA